ncbi:MAG: hypothetical protein FJ122_14315 [Deltaproteobacteria bacterium]|nr:hypothetical protein [Deltaproteobacteria bacterium]
MQVVPGEKERVFQAPAPLVVVFYGVLAVWTVGTIPPIARRFMVGGFSGDWLFAFMIGFFYLYTWYWSLGLIYRISLDARGTIRLSSLRRRLEAPAAEVIAIEGSRFSGGFGFIRIKLPRESVYLFCHRLGGDLEEILRLIKRANPLIRTVRI